MAGSVTIAVFGAYGHTGRFIVSELLTRRCKPILAGRDRDKLEAMSIALGGLEVRQASIDSPESLDRALTGASAVINSAGPFAFTAAPVMEAALRQRIPYLDVVAEPEIAAAAFEQYDDRARRAGIAIVPAAGFYGGLGGLLATAAMGDWREADEICLAYALSSWKPTAGTRATIEAAAQRRGGRRLVLVNGRLELREGSAPVTEWTFPAPIGTQPVAAEFTTADSVTISHHLKTKAVREYMTLAPLKDLSDPDLSAPPAVDATGRSAQTFLVEAVVRWRGMERRATASGQDIYAVSAPLVVEAAQRILARSGEITGVIAPGQIGDAREFLEALTPQHLALAIA